MFSVTAATLGRKVVAVDASIQNLAYIDKSVHLNGNQKNVKLINNAVRCLDWSPYVKYIFVRAVNKISQKFSQEPLLGPSP